MIYISFIMTELANNPNPFNMLVLPALSIASGIDTLAAIRKNCIIRLVRLKLENIRNMMWLIEVWMVV